MGIFIFIFFFVAANIYGIVMWGFVMYNYWYWFFLPVFPDMPIITVAQAIGLSFVVSLFRNHTSVSIKKEYIDSQGVIINAVFSPILALVVGWISYNILF